MTVVLVMQLLVLQMVGGTAGDAAVLGNGHFLGLGDGAAGEANGECSSCNPWWCWW